MWNFRTWSVRPGTWNFRTWNVRPGTWNFRTCNARPGTWNFAIAIGCGSVRIPFSIPSRSSHSFDVVGFGLNSVDLLAVVAEYPVCNTKQRLQRVARLPG